MHLRILKLSINPRWSNSYLNKSLTALYNSEFSQSISGQLTFLSNHDLRLFFFETETVDKLENPDIADDFDFNERTDF